MNVLQEKGQEEETEGILENQAQEVNIVDAVKQKNPFILLGIGVVLIAAIGGLIWSKRDNRKGVSQKWHKMTIQRYISFHLIL